MVGVEPEVQHTCTVVPRSFEQAHIKAELGCFDGGNAKKSASSCGRGPCPPFSCINVSRCGVRRCSLPCDRTRTPSERWRPVVCQCGVC